MVYSYHIHAINDRGYLDIVDTISADGMFISAMNSNVIEFKREGRIVAYVPVTAVIIEDQDM